MAGVVTSALCAIDHISSSALLPYVRSVAAPAVRAGTAARQPSGLPQQQRRPPPRRLGSPRPADERGAQVGEVEQGRVADLVGGLAAQILLLESACSGRRG